VPQRREGLAPPPSLVVFASAPKKKYIYIENLKKSPTILIVISYNLKPEKISYANGRVSVRIFYKNNLINAISFLSTHATHADTRRAVGARLLKRVPLSACGHFRLSLFTQLRKLPVTNELCQSQDD
jgi:hypothetical protein